MIRTLAALVALLFTARAQDKPPDKPADDFVEIKWDVQKDDRLDFKWTYEETRKRTPGQGDPTDNSDRREAVGEIWLREGENGQPAVMVLTLKKASWTVTSREHDIAVTYVEGKKTDMQVKIKGDVKATPQAKEALKTTANLLGDSMKKGTEGEFTLYIDPRRTETIIYHDGRPAKPGPSLFDHIYLHSPIPNQLVRLGQTWKEKVDAQIMPTGLMEASEMEYKVTGSNATTANFKSGFQMPISKITAGSDEKVSGSFTVTCDFVWNRAGYLQSSKEDVNFTKKVDATGKFAAFYKEDSSAIIKQAVTIKRKAPPKQDDKKDGEKKPEEKKPGEKK